ncbi:MAG: hypothetical protein U0871_23890 [Gemmataceae bacterium]
MGLLVALALAASADPPAPTADRYYLLLFGGQAVQFRPQTAHTWATFVRTAVTPAGEVVAERFTISWLPCQMPVKPLKLRPEPGRNYGLHETLDLMTTGRQELALWGPWEIRPEWYAQAVRYKGVLDSGQVKYQTLDRGDRRPDINHCVHAITMTDPVLHETSKPIAFYGELITRRLANAMDKTGLLADPCVTHDWLLDALDVARYPFKRRTLDEPVLRFRR